MFHVWSRSMSRKFSRMVRCDLDSVVTCRYERSEMAAAMAALPWTTACSPKTMTLPGADTMKGGAMGDEAFLPAMVVGVSTPLLAGLEVGLVVVEEGVGMPSELSWLSSEWPSGDCRTGSVVFSALSSGGRELDFARRRLALDTFTLPLLRCLCPCTMAVGMLVEGRGDQGHSPRSSWTVVQQAFIAEHERRRKTAKIKSDRERAQCRRLLSSGDAVQRRE